ncbi:hypothetical protein Hdeb2414_s0064g00765451 [Helianthus debilis subsp. tardiflorus]
MQLIQLTRWMSQIGLTIHEVMEQQPFSIAKEDCNFCYCKSPGEDMIYVELHLEI